MLHARASLEASFFVNDRRLNQVSRRNERSPMFGWCAMTIGCFSSNGRVVGPARSTLLIAEAVDGRLEIRYRESRHPLARIGVETAPRGTYASPGPPSAPPAITRTAGAFA